jgi:hypothetical protein
MKITFATALGALVLLWPVQSFAALPTTLQQCDELTNFVFGADGRPGTIRLFVREFQRPVQQWDETHWQQATDALKACAQLYTRQGMRFEGEQLFDRGQRDLAEQRNTLLSDARQTPDPTQQEELAERARRKEREIRQEVAARKKREAEAEELKRQPHVALALARDAGPAIPCPDLFNAAAGQIKAVGFFEKRLSVPASQWNAAHWRAAFSRVNSCYRDDLPEQGNLWADVARGQLLERYAGVAGLTAEDLRAVNFAVADALESAYRARLTAQKGVDNERLIADFRVFQKGFRPDSLAQCYADIKAKLPDPRSFAPDSYRLIDPTVGGGSLKMLQAEQLKMFGINPFPANGRPLFVTVRLRAKNEYGAYEWAETDCVYYVDNGQVRYHRLP